jgi:ABC-type uncharacterized transport system YnjBCD permease subunit
VGNRGWSVVAVHELALAMTVFAVRTYEMAVVDLEHYLGLT